MTDKRFTLHKGLDTLNIMDNTKFNEHIYINKSSKDMELLVGVLNALHNENEQLKQYKQAVSDVLMDWSVKNLSANEFIIVHSIMKELNVGDVE